jgi:malate dehydrogenase (oxaloacetate-decarboxylating)(NADP+)
VAKAAMDSGVAKTPIQDWDAYANDLLRRIGRDNALTRGIAERAKKDKKRVVFAEGDNPKVLKAAEIAKDEGVAIPILLGQEDHIRQMIVDFDLDLQDVEIIDPRLEAHQAEREKYGELFYQRRMRKGVNQTEAVRMMRERNYFGAMMVETGVADAMISGMTRNYAKVIRPGLQAIGPAKDVKTVCGMYIVQTPNGPLFFADTTVNVNPTAEQLVEITLLVSEAVQKLKISPRIAMVSYSNFGSAEGDDAAKVSKAVSILHEKHPHLIVDGDIQANFALNAEMRKEIFPFSKLSDARVNTLIFPNLSAGNSSYKLLQEISGMEVIGPILLGMKRSYHILQMGCSVREIVNMVRVAVIDAQAKGSLKR